MKDVVPRYQTMRGHRVARRFGWDTHGLPAEMEAEKELGIGGHKAINEFGIDKFNEYCRTSVLRYTAEWERYVNRQARWVDFQDDYKTMDAPYMESVIWAFSELYRKGLVYEAKRVMLGVKAATLETFGAVSKETATAMAIGALEKAGVDLAVSITGIAGPGGATPGKPVGLVHFAVAARDGRILHREQRFGAIGRSAVRQRSVVEALRMLMELARPPQAAKPRRETASRLRPRVARSPRSHAAKRRRPPRG